MAKVHTDIEIARRAKIQPIKKILTKLNVPDKSSNFSPMGRHIAKINFEFINKLKSKKEGHLILVTAITPTAAGEGKTTTSVGLSDALNRIKRKSIVCLREPSLGPSFGMKGGAAGGGYAQVIPMEQINLHFTGDFHAITSAHNLLSSMIDNHIYWGNKLNIDEKRIVWKRVLDINDRALRFIEINKSGITKNFKRVDGFDITVASEVMAIFCLSNNLRDLEKRIGNITIAYKKNGKPVFARNLNAHGPMTVLLKEALRPNIVQTLENNPAIIHGGPFANIAHGCNSVIATKTALKLGDFVVTEAGFGADLGAEKFFNIKCRKAGFVPSCVIIVATIRALKMHGGVTKNNLKKENINSLKKGLINLEKHIINLKKFGLNPIVAINHFITDTKKEINTIRNFCNKLNVEVSECKHWSKGGYGTIDLAKKVIKLCENKKKTKFKYLYKDKLSLIRKVETIAKELYGASKILINSKIQKQLKNFEKRGYRNLPVCIAKTQYSFSTNPNLKGAPLNHKIEIREVKLLSGAEFIVIICGSIMTMPGLPRIPAANYIKLNKKGFVEGLF